MERLNHFETETCTRCCGSGAYSYCQMYGRTCFKCRGKKNTLSKRGEAAQRKFQELITVPMKDVAAGWLFWKDADPLFGSGAKWVTVEKVSEPHVYGWSLDPATGKCTIEAWGIDIVSGDFSFTGQVDNKVKAVPNKEALKQAKEAALDYQVGLTKEGKEAKRKVAA